MVVITAALISVVEEPDISNLSDFVVWACEEFLEILCWLNQFW